MKWIHNTVITAVDKANMHLHFYIVLRCFLVLYNYSIYGINIDIVRLYAPLTVFISLHSI